jgi:ADP-ribose pyrophosphatase YjhB (NUDIX family)
MTSPQTAPIKYNSEDVVSHHGVAAVIENERGDILMQEHVKFGFWTIPVGKVKASQSITDALREEIAEECNVQIEKYRELVVKDFLYVREGNEVRVISHLFEVINYTGEMKNLEPAKHKQQLFLPIEEIKKLSYLSDMTLLYLKHLGFDRPARI